MDHRPWTLIHAARSLPGYCALPMHQSPRIPITPRAPAFQTVWGGLLEVLDLSKASVTSPPTPLNRAPYYDPHPILVRPPVCAGFIFIWACFQPTPTDQGSRTLDLRILFSGRKILQPLDVLYYNIISIEASAGSAIMQRATVVGWRYVVLGSRPLWQM